MGENKIEVWRRDKMNNYTFSFGGYIIVIVEAETEEEARKLVDELVPVPYVYDNCEDMSVDELELTDVEEVDEW